MRKRLAALHLMADFCLVSSLHDGMNLVAKEFVASRIDGDGVLILSAFTGAARELTDALIVNPFAVDEMAEAIHQAVNMPAAERRRRMNKMRSVVAANNVYRWAGKILLTLSGMDVGDAQSRPVSAACGSGVCGGGLMKYCLASLPEIDPILRAAGRILIATDFDGTLCPIVDLPAEACVAPATLEILQQAADCNRITLAVISGRASGRRAAPPSAGYHIRGESRPGNFRGRR